MLTYAPLLQPQPLKPPTADDTHTPETKMKTEYIRIRTTPRRFNKLKLLAEEREKSMTQLIEDWIDSLPTPHKENITVSAHDTRAPSSRA